MTPFIAVLAAAALAAAACDVRTRRIPNVLTGALAVAGVLMAGLMRGYGGAAVALATLALLLVAGTFVFSRAWFGGGDIKLLAAGCCGLVPAQAVDFLLFTALCGGLLSLYALATSRSHGLTTLLITWRPPTTGKRLPYAVAVCGGALCLWVALLCPAFLPVR